MKHLVDTNVFSEIQRGANCNSGVHTWWAAQSESDLFLSVPVVDSLLAATAIHHGMTLVTRNTRDIEHTGVEFLNPFSEP